MPPTINYLYALFRSLPKLLSLILLLLLPVAHGVAASGCGEPATPISEVQGRGDASPLAGHQVTVEGILTFDARMDGSFGGFYLQQADDETDDDPATSEALFIYTRKKTGSRGDRLRITGTVKEFHGLTELTRIKTIKNCGTAELPERRPLTRLKPNALESLENMRVKTVQPLTVIDSWNLARFGELTLAMGDQIAPTEYTEPGPLAVKIANRNQQQRIRLDDGRGNRNPRPIPWPPGGLSDDSTVRGGDTIQELTGVLDYRFSAWRIQPETSPVFESVNARRPAPKRPEKRHMRVMTLNLENYFNGDGEGGDFPTARGAQTASGFERQHQRLLAAIKQPDPDVLAVTELENDGYSKTSALAELARALGSQWKFVATPGADGGDEIRTSLLFRRDRIATESRAERLNTGLFQHQGRPPLAQILRLKGQSLAVRVVVTHLKSKSCRDADEHNRNRNNGQGCYAQRRKKSAAAVVQWLEHLPQPPDLEGTLITGDFNSYFRETAMQVFAKAGYTSMVHHFHPCTPKQCDHYTYRYKGVKGSLDYALASPSLKSRILSARTWSINADEPRALGYKNTLPGTADSLWRSSDHNPVITDIGF